MNTAPQAGRSKNRLAEIPATMYVVYSVRAAASIPFLSFKASQSQGCQTPVTHFDHKPKPLNWTYVYTDLKYFIKATSAAKFLAFTAKTLLI